MYIVIEGVVFHVFFVLHFFSFIASQQPSTAARLQKEPPGTTASVWAYGAPTQSQSSSRATVPDTVPKQIRETATFGSLIACTYN